VNAVDRIGAAVLAGGRHALYLIGLVYLTAKTSWLLRRQGRREFRREILLQVYFTGVQAIGPVVTLAALAGIVVVAEGLALFGTLSGAGTLGRQVTALLLREVGPLLVAGVVIARSVTAIAAELGTMRVRREIEALEVMGVSPIRQLVAPRLIGGVLALAGLNVLFGAAALAVGLAAARAIAAVPAGLFLGAALSAVSAAGLLAVAAKVVLGGLGIMAIACYHGFDVQGAPTEVPVAVSRAALNALLFMIVLHASLTLLALVTGAAPIPGVR
jgi:phospholipid/cholesterol/gamma-HCH transport system permease protein